MGDIWLLLPGHLTVNMCCPHGENVAHASTAPQRTVTSHRRCQETDVSLSLPAGQKLMTNRPTQIWKISLLTLQRGSSFPTLSFRRSPALIRTRGRLISTPSSLSRSTWPLSACLHAIIQPGMFYDNFPQTPEPLGLWKAGFLFKASKVSCTLGLYHTPSDCYTDNCEVYLTYEVVACRDMGYLVAQALTKRDQHEGRTIAFAGDKLSIDDVAQLYEKVDGTRPDTTSLPQEAPLPAGEDMNCMLRVCLSPTW